MPTNIFNSPEKRKETKQEISNYFQSGPGWFSSPDEDGKRKLAEKLAKDKSSPASEPKRGILRDQKP